MQPKIKVEFHCHTSYSYDCLVEPARLVARAREAGIDKLVITDHNVIAGAVEAARLDPDLVVVGEEIMTTKGELLAAFVMRKIPAGLPPLQAISRLREQGAFISVSHPFDRARHGWEDEDLREILPLVDAIETFNARCIDPRLNRRAQELALARGLPGTVGSDAHSLAELGAAALRVPAFNTADDLRSVISQGELEGKLSPFWVHFYSTYAKWKKRLAEKSA